MRNVILKDFTAAKVDFVVDPSEAPFMDRIIAEQKTGKITVGVIGALHGTFPNLLAIDVLQDSVAQKVAFVPGGSFYPCGGGGDTMRLNFSNACPENINEGIARLARVIRTRLSRK